MSDVDAELEALQQALLDDGVRLCEQCGMRPAKPKRAKKGPTPTKCEVCAPQEVLGTSQARERKPGEQAPPTSLNINLTPGKGTSRGQAKKDKEIAVVEAKAQQLAQFVAIGLTMVGQADDAADIVGGAELWAKAMGGLAPYEPWLVKLCEGGESAGRAMAWLAAVLATLGLATPVLLRHGVIPDGPLKAAFAGMSQVAAQAA